MKISPLVLIKIFRIFKVHQKPNTMAKVIITANVDESVQWEAGFRTHVDLFRKQTVNTPINFTANDNNEVAIIFEPDDLDTFLALMDTQETAEAMSFDGVKKETVKVFILDKELQT
jgi:hypothetical protein